MLYREIASREIQKRSPRLYSQVNIQSPGTGIDLTQNRESKDFNTYSEVQSMLKGLFQNLNEADQAYNQQVQNNNFSNDFGFDNAIDLRTDFNSEFINPLHEDAMSLAGGQNHHSNNLYGGGAINATDLRKSQTQNHVANKHHQKSPKSRIQNISRISLQSLANNQYENSNSNNNQQQNQQYKGQQNNLHSIQPSQNYSQMEINTMINPEFRQQIDDRDANIQLLKDTNEELTNQLAMLSQRLDDLMLKVKQKQLQDDKNLQKLQDCGHHAQIERLQNQIQQREDETKKVRDRMQGQLKVKEREINNTLDKIQMSKKELVQNQKKQQMTESERVVDLEQKIIGIELKNKDLNKEIKQLKKMQHDQGNELVGLQNTDEYPEKIRSLMEEVRWAKDKQIELQEKISNEEKLVKRQKEHLLNLEDSKKELDMKYRRQVMKLGVASDNPDQQFDYKDIDQVQLLNKIIALEEQLQARNKENKLFTMKMKELTNMGQQNRQGLKNMPQILKASPRRQAKSAARNYKSSHSNHRSNTINASSVANHQKPFSLQNQTIDETTQALHKKKELAEQYSFLLGKLDRSRSNVRTDRSRSGGPLKKQMPKVRKQFDSSIEYGNNRGNLLLPKVNLKNNGVTTSRNIQSGKRSVIGSGLNQYYSQQNNQQTPKINIIAAPDSRNNNSFSQLTTPLKSQSKASSIKNGMIGNMSREQSESRKSLKKVEFADNQSNGLNDRSFDDSFLNNSSLNKSPDRNNSSQLMSNLKSLNDLQDQNISLNNNNGLKNFGTNRSIRRVKDYAQENSNNNIDNALNSIVNNKSSGGLSEFKINIGNNNSSGSNTDDLLQQFKNNLTSLI
eukprot:403374819